MKKLLVIVSVLIVAAATQAQEPTAFRSPMGAVGDRHDRHPQPVPPPAPDRVDIDLGERVKPHGPHIDIDVHRPHVLPDLHVEINKHLDERLDQPHQVGPARQFVRDLCQAVGDMFHFGTHTEAFYATCEELLTFALLGGLILGAIYAWKHK